MIEKIFDPEHNTEGICFAINYLFFFKILYRQGWRGKSYGMTDRPRFILLHCKNLFFEQVFSVSSPERQLLLISPIPGLNPSGGLPSESVQFGFLYRIVVEAPRYFMVV